MVPHTPMRVAFSTWCFVTLIQIQETTSQRWKPILERVSTFATHKLDSNALRSRMPTALATSSRSTLELLLARVWRQRYFCPSLAVTVRLPPLFAAITLQRFGLQRRLLQSLATLVLLVPRIFTQPSLLSSLAQSPQLVHCNPVELKQPHHQDQAIRLAQTLTGTHSMSLLGELIRVLSLCVQ